jgi:membrane associated rhomboid family serine protease
MDTWSGRLLILNVLVFLWMVWCEPASFLVPSSEFIRAFGSKSLADIANGEYWRFITPMFVHIGFIHLFFNCLGIYYIGYQIESILGARWFVALYLMAGIVGNLSSCVFSLAPSAGASGALFGLLGAGFRLEGLVGRVMEAGEGPVRPRKRVYAGMVVSNLILGLVIPVIDNAAHLGGLVTGWLLMEAVLRTRPNRIRTLRPWISYAIYTALGAFILFAVIRTADPVVVGQRYFDAGLKAANAQESYMDFSEAIRVRSLDEKARLYRGKLLLQNGEIEAGAEDIKIAIKTSRVTDGDIKSMTDELELTGHRMEAELVRKLYLQGGSRTDI